MGKGISWYLGWEYSGGLGMKMVWYAVRWIYDGTSYGEGCRSLSSKAIKSWRLSTVWQFQQNYMQISESTHLSNHDLGWAAKESWHCIYTTH